MCHFLAFFCSNTLNDIRARSFRIIRFILDFWKNFPLLSTQVVKNVFCVERNPFLELIGSGAIPKIQLVPTKRLLACKQAGKNASENIRLVPLGVQKLPASHRHVSIMAYFAASPRSATPQILNLVSNKCTHQGLVGMKYTLWETSSTEKAETHHV